MRRRQVLWLVRRWASNPDWGRYPCQLSFGRLWAWAVANGIWAGLFHWASLDCQLLTWKITFGLLMGWQYTAGFLLILLSWSDGAAKYYNFYLRLTFGFWYYILFRELSKCSLWWMANRLWEDGHPFKTVRRLIYHQLEHSIPLVKNELTYNALTAQARLQLAETDELSIALADLSDQADWQARLGGLHAFISQATLDAIGGQLSLIKNSHL